MKRNASEFEQIMENNRSLSMRNSSIPGISDNKWKEVMDQQEFYLMMLEIREELLSRVLDECYKKYIEKESIKYIVDCAYLSWKQIVDINFYVHDRLTDFYGNNSLWIPDEELEPCIADSWAKGNISVKPCSLANLDTQKAKTVISDYQIIESFDYPTENKFNIQDESKSDNVSEICESDSCIKPIIEVDKSVHFTSFVSNNEIVDDKMNEPVKEKISEEFTKNLKAMRKKNLSVCGPIGNIKKKPPISWFDVDRYVEPPHRLHFPLLR
ncbi:hypothetical protein CBL_09379 [Carabus blaptoides fortunei]